jgi:hypothetical protein
MASQEIKAFMLCNIARETRSVETKPLDSAFVLNQTKKKKKALITSGGKRLDNGGYFFNKKIKLIKNN